MLAVASAVQIANSAVDREQLESLETHVTDFNGLQPNEPAPPDTLAGDEVLKREMVFLLDCSGSMSGLPLQASKTSIQRGRTRLATSKTGWRRTAVSCWS